VNDVVVHAPNDGLCDNGDFCDGSETCDVVNDCQAGTPPTISDGVGCTDDSCDEVNDVIINTPNHAYCGTEYCDAVADCSSDGNPCAPGEICNETTNTCEGGEEIIIDNGGTGTSWIGTWSNSSGSGYYGSVSVFTFDAATSYTFEADVNGSYDVYLRWTYHESRCSNVAADIYDGAIWIDTVYVNQLQDGGQWNKQGTYNFNGTAAVVIRGDGDCSSTSFSVNADAVRFAVPDSNCGNGATQSCGTDEGECQSGTQTCVNGQWSACEGDIGPATEVCDGLDNDCDGLVDNADPSCIEEMIIDNGDTGTLSTGTWNISGGPNPYDTNSLFADAAGATYTFEYQFLGAIMSLDVYQWWTYYSNRCIDTKIEISDSIGLLDTLYINQRENVSQWYYYDRYLFENFARVSIISEGGCSVNADAVKFVNAGSVCDNGATQSCGTDEGECQSGTQTCVNGQWSACEGNIGPATEVCDGLDNDCDGLVDNADPSCIEEMIIDNGGTGTSWIGTWSNSSGSGYYGSVSVYTFDAATSYTFSADVNGSYDVYLRWTYHESRCSNVAADIYDGAVWIDTVYVNQLQDGGQWNKQGTYNFNGTAAVVIRGDGDCSSTSFSVNADAVRFVSSLLP
jgi:hypothetical protein